jgi:phosphoribosylglycinamide formyltransferase 1
MKNIAIFASGEGTNAQNIIDHFKMNKNVNVKLVVCNKPNANVLNRAVDASIQTLLINRNAFYESKNAIHMLENKHIDLIVLAGFLWLIPANLIEAFPNKIINIHPALLPKFGGQGMYGAHVHKAVVEAKEKESGITIHFVNEKYDEGAIIAQYTCAVTENDTAESVATKIHDLEQTYFPQVIEQVISELND